MWFKIQFPILMILWVWCFLYILRFVCITGHQVFRFRILLIQFRVTLHDLLYFFPRTRTNVAPLPHKFAFSDDGNCMSAFARLVNIQLYGNQLFHVIHSFSRVVIFVHLRLRCGNQRIVNFKSCTFCNEMLGDENSRIEWASDISGDRYGFQLCISSI